MKSSRSLFALAVAVALSSSAAFFNTVADTAAYIWRRGCSFFTDAFLGMVSALPHTEAPGSLPKVGFQRAKAFKARILHRERPRLTESWRMCPSV